MVASTVLLAQPLHAVTGKNRPPAEALLQAAEPAPSREDVLVLGSSSQPLAAVRVSSWSPGTIDDETLRGLSLWRLRDLDQRRVTLIEVGVGRALPATSARSLGVRAFAYALRSHRSELVVTLCPPGQLLGLLRLGYRPFGARPLRRSGGVLIPLVAVVGDLAHLKEVHSPLWLGAWLVDRVGGSARFPHDELVRSLRRVGGVTWRHPEVMARIGEAALRAGPARLLGRLPVGVHSALAEQGYVLEVPAGTELITAGSRRQELYLVLDGSFEVRRPGRTLRRCVVGQPFGELARLRGCGERSATVSARRRGMVLVLPPHALKLMEQERPQAAEALNRGISEVMAERIAAM